MPTRHESPGVSPERAFLLRVTELLHAYGTPAFRLERVLQKVARSLGIEGSFFSTPTAVFVSLGAEPQREVRLLRSDSGEVDLGKLVEFDEVMEDVEHGRVSAADALPRLEEIAAASSRYPALVSACGYGLASASAARFFGGGLIETAIAFAMAIGIFALGRVLPRRPDTIGLYEPISAFLVASLSLIASRTVFPFDDRVVTLAGLIVLVPGLTLTVGLTELATRHLMSGIARLAGAGTVFLTLLFGVAVAWRLELLLPPQQSRTAAELPEWTLWLAAVLTPLAFAIILEARPRELGVILMTALSGYAAARVGAATLGTDLGPFLGALSVGVLANVYARRVNRPALVPLTPGILLLVPGSLGFFSLTSFLDEQALAGMTWAFQTGMVAVSLVGGLLAANVVLPPRRAL